MLDRECIDGRCRSLRGLIVSTHDAIQPRFDEYQVMSTHDVGDAIEGCRERYEILEHIGSGGFGHTYRARSEGGEVVAVKVLRIEKLDDWKALELFEREARALRRLDHPQIPRYVEFFAHVDGGPVSLETLGSEDVQPEALFLVQHYVDGVDLSRRMENDESFTSEQVESIMRQTLEVLRYLHELNPPVIHRDINPRNIILDDEGRVSLVDFGAIQEKLREETVGGSTSVGTLGYIPIEQSFGKARPASDLYSLGVTVVALMTGQRPTDWSIDESSKIDLGDMGLSPYQQDSVVRVRVLKAVDAMLEPLVAQRVDSARDAVRILDGEVRPAREHSPQIEPDDPPVLPTWKRYVFNACWMGGLGAAVVIYGFFFGRLSETELVEISAFWLLPAAFGVAGHMLKKTDRPMTYAVGATIGSAVALMFFFEVIWPGL